jgi:two-component system response regulator
MTAAAILLVEDSPDDVELTLEALRRNHIPNPVVVARDGVEALDYLEGAGAHAGGGLPPLPALVMLDLNLPRIDGHAVLRRLRGHERTRSLPVVMLSTSADERDIAQSHALGANAYVRKPVAFEDFVESIGRLCQAWLQPAAAAPGPRG